MSSTQIFKPVMGVMRWGVLMLGLLSLNGCDYWPPALQSQIEGLRAALNDALDDRQRLDQELRGLRTVQNSLEQVVEAKARENKALQQRLATLLKTPDRHPSAEPEIQAGAGIAARRGPTANDLLRPSPVRKGSYDSLELTSPHRRGPHVEQVQRLLRRHGLPIHVDGIYGGATEAAVRSFQQVHKLPANGVVGPVTYRILHSVAPTAQPVRQLQLQRPPIMGPDVLQVQRALHHAGHRIPVDGHYGPETDIAVTRFQRKHGLEPDGIVGPQTWDVLKKKIR
jgi:peptidoglycan hydrolase-like protein with peptidoglycan-binding domain